MKRKECQKNILGIILMLSILAFMIILTIVESIYYIIAVLSTILFVVLLCLDHNADRQQLWGQLVGVPFALCIAIIIRNLVFSVWR